MGRGLFDHLVGAAEQGEWEREAERFRGLQVDRELNVGGLLHQQVGGLFALDDAADVTTGNADGLPQVGAVPHEARRARIRENNSSPGSSYRALLQLSCC